jgi:glucokinase
MAKRGKRNVWVGFDLGGTKMLAVVFDDRFRRIGERRRKTRPSTGSEKGLPRIVSTISMALEDAGIPKANLAGIGVGSPGPLDLERGILLDTPNLGWGRLQLRAGIVKAFGCPAFVLNDADAGLYGEYRQGVAQGARCAVGIFPGTGIGGSCIYDGHMIRGATSSCFEIGHIQVQPDGPLCGCGKRGCLEAVASRLAISAAVAAAVYRGEAPSIAREAGTDLAAIRSSALARAIRERDPTVERIVRDAAHWIGIGAATVVNLLAPDVVVLGGGLVEAMPALFREEVQAAAQGRVMEAFLSTFKVRIAKLGDYANATGAAVWARDRLDGKM